jgi:hypothetical protein
MADDVQKQLDDLEQNSTPNVSRTYESYIADLAQRRLKAREDRRVELETQQQLESQAMPQASPQIAQPARRSGGRPHGDHFDYTDRPSGAYYRNLTGTKQHSGAYFRNKRA